MDSIKTAEQFGEVKATLGALRDDVGEIQKEVKLMNATLAVNTASLEQHIEGVRLAREQNDMLKKELEARLQPIQAHLVQTKLIVRICGWALGAPAVVYSIIQLLSFLKSGHT